MAHAYMNGTAHIFNISHTAWFWENSLGSYSSTLLLPEALTVNPVIHYKL